MKIPETTIGWLLETGSPAVRYNTRLLTGEGNTDRTELLKDPLVIECVEALKYWNEEVLERHNKPDLLIHRLALLAGLGVKSEDPGVPGIIETIMTNVNEEGVPEITIRIPKAFGGSGMPERAWIICDYPVVLYALAAMGVKHEAVDKAVGFLTSLVDNNGCRCRGSFPKFRGPGRKDDMCPIACLYTARVLALADRTAVSKAAEYTVDALLRHWDERRQKKYFLFGIGTDFMKLKFPFVWYNLLNVLDAVSRFPQYRIDKRVIEMADALTAKAGDGLRFKPESVYLSYKRYDFADKKQYSPMVTLMALGILKRLGKVK